MNPNAVIFLVLLTVASIVAVDKDNHKINLFKIENSVKKNFGTIISHKSSEIDLDRLLQSDDCANAAYDCTLSDMCSLCANSFDVDKFEEAILRLPEIVTCEQVFEAFAYGFPSFCDVYSGPLYDLMICSIFTTFSFDCSSNSISQCRNELESCEDDISCSLCLENLDRTLIGNEIVEAEIDGTIIDFKCEDLLQIFQNGLPESCVIESTLYDVATCTMSGYNYNEPCPAVLTPAPTMASTQKTCSGIQNECSFDSSCDYCVQSIDENEFFSAINTILGNINDDEQISCSLFKIGFEGIYSAECSLFIEGNTLFSDYISCLINETFSTDLCPINENSVNTLAPTSSPTMSPTSLINNAIVVSYDEDLFADCGKELIDCELDSLCSLCYGVYEPVNVIEPLNDAFEDGLYNKGVCSDYIEIFQNGFHYLCELDAEGSILNELIKCSINQIVGFSVCL
eukprot:CAMPEP_0171478172 /NCGR_PEP_ID=MMETSP0946-20130122/4619_1 /TAXON_ID=109269 /ORGANISM="Vaucheria litorea, Strain CCMP2940" /LENGTH=455 /DNA_ID=CAMNT_0012008757 /DNA_START=21 /DNA_END=1388 /DNA_ORIENTATION=-